jgi:hypothetical protein
MKGLATFSLALLLASGGSAEAAVYQDELLTLEVPPGFEGPVREAPGPGASAVAYVKRYSASDRGTLLQITKYDFGTALQGMPEDRRGETADFYLKQFLDGIARRRTSFMSAEPTRVSLGRIAASRAEWTGIAQGQPMSGVMYCVVVGTVVVSFHTQDFRDAPAENRALVVRSFEAVTFK